MRVLLGPLQASPVGMRVQPPGVSQALNPTLEALGLRRHKTGVMKGMSQDRNALHGGKAGARQGRWSLSPSRVPETGSRSRPGVERKISVALVATEPPALWSSEQNVRPRSRALPRDPCSRDGLDAGAKPILGRSSFVPSLPLRGQLR